MILDKDLKFDEYWIEFEGTPDTFAGSLKLCKTFNNSEPKKIKNENAWEKKMFEMDLKLLHFFRKSLEREKKSLNDIFEICFSVEIRPKENYFDAKKYCLTSSNNFLKLLFQFKMLLKSS